MHSLMHPWMVTQYWRRSKRDENLVRFGLLWRCYDVVSRWMSGGARILALPEGKSLETPFLRRGYAGTEFLVQSLGLSQPRAGKGVISFWSDPRKTRKYKYKRNRLNRKPKKFACAIKNRSSLYSTFRNGGTES